MHKETELSHAGPEFFFHGDRGTIVMAHDKLSFDLLNGIHGEPSRSTRIPPK
jgi:hypothetical protein